MKRNLAGCGVRGVLASGMWYHRAVARLLRGAVMKVSPVLTTRPNHVTLAMLVATLALLFLLAANLR